MVVTFRYVNLSYQSMQVKFFGCTGGCPV